MRCKVTIRGNDLFFTSEEAAIKFLQEYHLEHLIPLIEKIACTDCSE